MKRAEPIAIIGMRGRFPGANDLDQYWKNLAEGVESIAVLTPEEMRAAGIPDHISRLPGYVNASPVLEGIRTEHLSLSPLQQPRLAEVHRRHDPDGHQR
jgi:acyl transferase domain-containing protein